MNKLNIVLIVFALTMLFAKIATAPLTSGQIVYQWLGLVIDLILFIMMLLACFFLIQLAVASDSKRRKVSFFLLAVLISSLFVLLISFQPDDEMLISLFAYHSLLNLSNPYAHNYATLLQPALTQLGVSPTYLQNGAIVGNYDYPVLYLLVQVPFYLMFNPTPLDLGQYVMPAEYIVFFGFFLYCYYLLMKERKTGLPNYTSIILASIPFLVFSSTIILLMLGLIILMFTEAGKKKAWLILGVMASLQQELWILVLLFLMYEWKNSGSTEALKTSINAFFVFFAINGFFIYLNPAAFLQSFLQVGSLMPNYIAPLGSLLLIFGYHPIVPLFLFACSVVLILVFAYESNKRWIPLLSAIPYLFISHSLPIYYLLPFAAFALISD